MCRSLEEAHDKKIVHRDLKPSNVMICQVAQAHDFVKVLDFGLAKPFGAGGGVAADSRRRDAGHARIHGARGGRGEPYVDARADLYALGCVAYVLLTGTLVFTDSNPVAVALKHMRTPPVPPSQRTEPSRSARSRARDSAVPRERPERRVPVGARSVERMLAACNVPPWTDEDAAAWWQASSAADVAAALVLAGLATDAVARAESVNDEHI